MKNVSSKPRSYLLISIEKFWQSPTGVLGFILVSLVILTAILAPVISPYSPTEAFPQDRLQGPTENYLLGTDEIGRDLLSRVIHGAWLALRSGIVSVTLAFTIGVPLGLISGFSRVLWVDNLIMRVMDGLSAFPSLVLAIGITAALGYSQRNALIAIAVTFVPTFSRLARAQILSEQEEVYVEAARCIGATEFRIVVSHIFRNIASPMIVQASLMISAAIMAEASLSFLGIGAQPPAPNWGTMLKMAIGYLRNNIWMAISPGVALFITVLGLNFLGDGLRDAFDPTTLKR